MTEQGHGLQIVNVSKTHRYELNKTELESLLLREDVRDLPVVVVSVAGAYRGGKSFLLNCFLRYLSAPVSAREDGSWLAEDGGPLVGFQWRYGIKATTMGVLMWSEPFITTLPSGEKVAILLVDTQGNFDNRSTVRDNSTIFAFSTLVSSIQIFNISQNIQEDDLQHLELFTAYGKLMKSSSGKAFQVLEFLVRDWQYPDDHPYGAVGGEHLLHDLLEIPNTAAAACATEPRLQVWLACLNKSNVPAMYDVGNQHRNHSRLRIQAAAHVCATSIRNLHPQAAAEVTDGLATEMKRLRENIQSSFEKISCFLMPHPGFEVARSKKFNGNISDIDPQFRAQLKDLVNSLFGSEKLLPKKINGERVKAGDLCNYFKTYIELFNSDKIPSPTTILEATVKAGLLSAVNAAREFYEKGMDSECGPKQLCVPLVDLKYLHKKYVGLAIDNYRKQIKMGSPELQTQYEAKLTKELNERLEQFVQSNLSKILKAMNEAKEAYDQSIKDVTKDDLLCVHAIDLDKIHNAAINAAMNVYDAAKKRVSQLPENERADFEQKLQEKKNSLRLLNNQNNTHLVNNLKNEYWNKMQGKVTAVSTPLPEPELMKEHNIALNEALAEFESKRNIQSKYTEDVYKYNLTKNIVDILKTLKSLNESKNKELIEAAGAVYKRSMNEFWTKDIQCMHPGDLEDADRSARCLALTVFRPSKSCPSGASSDDKDEVTLYEILNDKYQSYETDNDNANEIAVAEAYDKYTSVKNNKIIGGVVGGVGAAILGFVAWPTLLITVPTIVAAEVTNSPTAAAKDKFYSMRRKSDKTTPDRFLDLLMEKIG